MRAVATGVDTARRKWGAFRPDLYPLAIDRVRYVGDEIAAVAAVAAEEWTENDLFATIRRAYPFRNLEREQFDSIVRMLADGFTTKRGRRSTYLHHDAVNQRLRGRRGARLAAITSGGAIPDTADYAVVLEPTDLVIGSVNEDFAIESLQGDIFQLGNTSWRVLRVEQRVSRASHPELASHRIRGVVVVPVVLVLDWFSRVAERLAEGAAFSLRDVRVVRGVQLADFDGAGDLCLRCHTPTGWLGGHSDPPNLTALSGSDFEGVSCDACPCSPRPPSRPRRVTRRSPAASTSRPGAAR